VTLIYSLCNLTGLDLSQKCETLTDIFQEIQISLFSFETFCNWPEFDSRHWIHQASLRGATAVNNSSWSQLI
jgi:hypothetical protein